METPTNQPQDTTSQINNSESVSSKDIKDQDNYKSKEEQITQTETTPPPTCTDSNGQWSPTNTSGRKVYDRDFLMKLKNDANSKIRPVNLPDLDVIIKDITKSRNSEYFKPKEVSANRYDSLFPGFAKYPTNTNVSLPVPQTRTFTEQPKMHRPRKIHVSLTLQNDVKLRESENAWKPRRFVSAPVSEEQNSTEILYKKVRSVLNKLTPQKFDTLVSQVRSLEIDTEEKLVGVIDLVFKKAIEEPNFSVAYALMCKELGDMQVANSESKDTSNANFRRILVTRCQKEFEKNTIDETGRKEKLKQIEECLDPEKKKELQMTLDEEERRMRMRSVGNIRFIGELFKQNMLTFRIMCQCIRNLLSQPDEENLECLCKLLTTVGKVLEDKKVDLNDFFKQMQKISKNRSGKVSSRIRFMLQDVIELRANKWVPRRADNNPKTMDQIQKEAETEELNILLNNASISIPRTDDRFNDRKRNRK